ncbi:HAD-IB family hydrolase [Psychrobacter aquimaris]|uniref:HAD-IB family hydrolase n=1 Tax=Psychrobacter aquimaris TaxID=292733 RepID=UPI0039C6054E
MSQSAPHKIENSRNPIAFFDFDGTLTTGDTLMPFLEFVVGKPRYYWHLLLVSPVLVGYLFKLIRNDVAKEAVLKRYLSRYQIEEVFALGETFSNEILPTMLRSAGIARLKWHQEQGHDCVLVSASLDVYLRSWAMSMGFDDLICTKLEVSSTGMVSGKIEGNNCYGIEKVKNIKNLNFMLNQRTVYAYGDTKGDYPMLKIADYGYMLNKKCFVLIKGL